METRKIGSLDVSVVGLGCNNFGGRLDASQTADVIFAALDDGVNFLDTADIYGGAKSEQLMGQALKGRRGEVILATKFGHKIDDDRLGAKPSYVKAACDASLRRLDTDYIDLYQLHRPDETTPIADTLAALDQLVKAGKVREIGCSNFSAQQLAEAEAAVAQGAARFVSLQNEYSLLHREPEEGALDECVKRDIAFIPYFPLRSGLLTGKIRKGQAAPEGSRLAGWAAGWVTDEAMDRVEALIAFAEARGHTVLELAFSWLLAQKPVASVIAGATSAEQVHANARSTGWNLTSEDLGEVDRILA